MILNSYPINPHIIVSTPAHYMPSSTGIIISNRVFKKMLNFASLFNQFRSQSNSGINELLDQPATKISRLLD